LTFARGYKPKAFNTVHQFSSLQDANAATSSAGAIASDALAAKAVDQEKINHIEAGFKSSLLDGRMTLNAAIFNTDYDGYQVQIFDTSAVIGLLRLVNGKARTRGAEADINWRATDSTRVSLSAAYIDAKITDFKRADCYPTQSVAQGCVPATPTVAAHQDLSGHPLPDSPKFKLNGSVEQRLPLDAVDVTLGANVAYRTDSLFQANGNPQTRQPGFALLNLSMGVASKDGKYSGTFFVNNVTDHFYLTNAEDFFSGAYAVLPTFAPANVVIGQPARDSHRYFGARLAVSF
jgi:iron complex outermembrane recepter protein